MGSFYWVGLIQSCWLVNLALKKDIELFQKDTQQNGKGKQEVVVRIIYPFFCNRGLYMSSLQHQEFWDSGYEQVIFEKESIIAVNPI